MSWTLITSADSTNSTTTSSVNTTGADLIIAAVGCFASNGPVAFSDNKSNTYTQIVTATDPTGRQIGAIYYKQNPTVGSGHTFSSTSAFACCKVFAYSGSLTSGSLDQSHSATFGSGTSSEPAGSVTTVSNGELIFLANFLDDPAQSGTPTATSPLSVLDFTNTSVGSLFGCCVSTGTQSTAGAINATLTRTNNIAASRGDVALVATFKPAAGGSQSISAAQGTYTLSGKTIVPDVGIPTAQGSYSLSGQITTLKVGMPGNQGTYTLSGKTLTAGYNPHPVQGSYSITGQSTILNIGIPVSQGTYTLTGEALTLGTAISSSQGTYTLNGQTVTLAKSGGQVISANLGTYTLTGETVNTGVGLPVSQGTYSLTGQNTTRDVGIIIPQGTYVLTGESVTLTQSQSGLSAGFGSYTISGIGAVLDYRSAFPGGGKIQQKLEQYVKQQASTIDVKLAAQHMSSLGGHARASALSSQQRMTIAKKAASIRWSK